MFILGFPLLDKVLLLLHNHVYVKLSCAYKGVLTLKNVFFTSGNPTKNGNISKIIAERLGIPPSFSVKT